MKGLFIEINTGKLQCYHLSWESLQLLWKPVGVSFIVCLIFSHLGWCSQRTDMGMSYLKPIMIGYLYIPISVVIYIFKYLVVQWVVYHLPASLMFATVPGHILLWIYGLRDGWHRLAWGWKIYRNWIQLGNPWGTTNHKIHGNRNQQIVGKNTNSGKFWFWGKEIPHFVTFSWPKIPNACIIDLKAKKILRS